MRRFLLLSAVGAFSILAFSVPTAAFADCAQTNFNSGYSTGAENLTVYGATQFTATCSGTISSVDLGVKINGVPPNVKLELWGDNGSSAPSTLIQAGDDTVVTGFGGTCGIHAFTFSTAPSVVSGTKYWLVAHQDSSSGYPNNMVWCYDGSNTSGLFRLSTDGSSWGSPDPQMYFDFNIIAGGGGGIPIGGATSTLEQAESNLSTAFGLFFVSMFGMIWLLRKR